MPRRSIPIRNTVARSPLLRKGGLHVESKTGQRVRARLSMNSAINEWLEESDNEILDLEQENGEQMLPDFLWNSVHFRFIVMSSSGHFLSYQRKLTDNNL